MVRRGSKIVFNIRWEHLVESIVHSDPVSVMGCKKQSAGEPRLCRSYWNWTSCRQRKASFFGSWFCSLKDTFTVPAHRSARCISFIHFKITSHVKGLKGNWQKVFMATELWAWLASLAGRFLSRLQGGKINTRNCGYAAMATDIICVRSEALTETGSCEGSNAPPEEWREDDLHPVGKTHLDQCDQGARQADEPPHLSNVNLTHPVSLRGPKTAKMSQSQCLWALTSPDLRQFTCDVRQHHQTMLEGLLTKHNRFISTTLKLKTIKSVTHSNTRGWLRGDLLLWRPRFQPSSLFEDGSHLSLWWVIFHFLHR